jgi:hypothetical protein
MLSEHVWRNAAKSGENPASNKAVLIIDLQNADGMQAQDADQFYRYLAQNLENMRVQNTPIIWVTMSEIERLHQPSLTVENYTREELYDLGFRSFFGTEETDAFDIFLNHSGPRRNEAVFQKIEKSAFAETAIDAICKDFEVTIRPDLILSWKDKNIHNPPEGHLIWGGPENSNFHWQRFLSEVPEELINAENMQSNTFPAYTL